MFLIYIVKPFEVIVFIGENSQILRRYTGSRYPLIWLKDVPHKSQQLHKPQKLLKPQKPQKSHSATIESIFDGQNHNLYDLISYLQFIQ